MQRQIFKSRRLLLAVTGKNEINVNEKLAVVVKVIILIEQFS